MMLRHDLPLLLSISIVHLATTLMFHGTSSILHRVNQLLHYRSSTYHQRRRGLFSTGNEEAVGISPSRSNLCIVYGDDDADENEQAAFGLSAKQTADSLDVPVFSFSEWNDEGFDESDQGFSHLLRLIPYKYKDDSGSLSISTYALAIEELPPFLDGRLKNASKSHSLAGRRTRKKLSRTPFFVDLCPPRASRAGRRVAGASGTSDLLLKAVVPGRGGGRRVRQAGATVYDLTAGFGQDSLILALNGAHRVRMVERNPVVAALLQDALRRLEMISNATQELQLTNPQEQQRKLQHPPLSSSSHLATLLFDKLSLSVGEGRNFVENGDDDVDVVYLDPMFPPRQKRAAVKKGMQLLHGLLDTQDSSSTVIQQQQQQQLQQQEHDLLHSAWRAAKLRVVVKRPLKAPPLGVESGDNATKTGDSKYTLRPSFAITGSVNRWDVYVKAASLSA